MSLFVSFLVDSPQTDRYCRAMGHKLEPDPPLTAEEINGLRKIRAAERQTCIPGNLSSATCNALRDRGLVRKHPDHNSLLLTTSGHAVLESALRGSYSAETRRGNAHVLRFAARLISELGPESPCEDFTRGDIVSYIQTLAAEMSP